MCRREFLSACPLQTPYGVTMAAPMPSAPVHRSTSAWEIPPSLRAFASGPSDEVYRTGNPQVRALAQPAWQAGTMYRPGTACTEAAGTGKWAGRGHTEGGSCALCPALEVRRAAAWAGAASAAGHGLRAGFEAVARGVGPCEGGLGVLHVPPHGLAELFRAIAPGRRPDPGRGRREEPALRARPLNHSSPSVANPATMACPQGRHP